MIIHGNCLEEMRKMEPNFISAIVTDPPYGLSFMGKGWDHAIPGPEYWKECFRIAKPGSFLLAMGGTRTFHRLTCAIEDSGFEIRDCISWLYGSGFPKSHNHFGIEGYGTALKPAWEPCILAMKPCDGTFKQNAEKWGQAGINIDGCRIGTEGATKRTHQSEYPKNENGSEDRSQHWARTGHNIKEISKGRWPANLILDEEAAQMLDEQSGTLTSGTLGAISKKKNNQVYGKFAHANINAFPANSGGASRFFYCAKASSSERNEGLEEFESISNMRVNAPRLIENDKFNTKVKNHHPTVKPLKLMEYLIKLIKPPKNGILLDPFAGSGTTILAAKRLGFDAIGIEKEAEYCEIAKARLANFQKKNIMTENKQLELFAKAG